MKEKKKRKRKKIRKNPIRQLSYDTPEAQSG